MFKPARSYLKPSADATTSSLLSQLGLSLMPPTWHFPHPANAPGGTPASFHVPLLRDFMRLELWCSTRLVWTLNIRQQEMCMKTLNMGQQETRLSSCVEQLQPKQPTGRAPGHIQSARPPTRHLASVCPAQHMLRRLQLFPIPLILPCVEWAL